MLRGSTLLLSTAIAVCVLAGCGRGQEAPTRTPVPTWTPTSVAANQNSGAAPAAQADDPALAAQSQPGQEGAPAPTPLPPTATMAPPADTPAPTSTPQPAPTDTPVAPTATPEPPTATPSPEPTPTPSYDFALEAAEKLPTEALAADVVRIWLYAYSPAELGLGGYSLRVTHNGTPLTVEEVSTAGIPGQTRTTPGPFTRFTNMNLLFVEPQAGAWEVQLIDPDGQPAGPPALFDLTADEVTRELYVRYKQVSQ